MAEGATTSEYSCQHVAISGIVMGNWELILFDTALRQYINLTQTPYDERDPALSPDGYTLAYSANSGDNWDLYLYDLGTGVRERLTDDPAYEGHPAWSPDGQQLLFESTRDGNLDIFMLHLASRAVTQLTHERLADVEPLWLPGGEAFIYASWRDGARQLFRQNSGDGAAVKLTEPGEEPRQTALASDKSLVYVRDGMSGPEIALRFLERDVVEILPRTGHHEWPSFAERAGVGELITLELMEGQANRYPEGWQLTTSAPPYDRKQLLLRLRGSWEKPNCAPPMSRRTSQAWKSIGQLNTDAYLSTLDLPGPHELVELPGVQARQPVLSSAVAASFLRLRSKILEESGYNYLGSLNDVWRGLDHPGEHLLSWHRAGRAFDTLDWFATDRQRLYIGREEYGQQTYFRIYLLARSQDGNQGRPLRASLWFTEGRLADAEMLQRGGRYSIPPEGYFVDFTDLAARENWTRIPALTPPHGDWRSRYIDLEFWHYERRGGLRWYDAMREVYSEGDLTARFGIRRLLRRTYTWQEIQAAGIPGSEIVRDSCLIQINTENDTRAC